MVLKVNNNPAGIYFIKVNDRNTRKMYVICSKLKIKTPERRHWQSILKNDGHLLIMYARIVLPTHEVCKKNLTALE